MAGIAGAAGPERRTIVDRLLDTIKYRGRGERIILDHGGTTFGVHCSRNRGLSLVKGQIGVMDYAGTGHFAIALINKDGALVLERDPLGIAPLYYGSDGNGTLCFASEVKALLKVTTRLQELPPGCRLNGSTTERYFELPSRKPLSDPPEKIAAELRKRVETAVAESIDGEIMGAWLSGGLDSSSLAALARQQVKTLHTFSAGLAGAPDLKFAREVAGFIGSEHHEVTVTFEQMLHALPTVIYHLESFDAWLVRSSIMNYLVARVSADYVPAVISGEGGDELFAGYEYLKHLPREGLVDELLDITRRLHNTALQRVDRCASAHGLTAHVCFLHPEVLEYALRIPVACKIQGGTEKWILRRAMEGVLPDDVLQRPKAKFWEGSGVSELLNEHAEGAISDGAFIRERTLLNGWTLRSKEELMYYRIFKEHFGALTNLSWIGRTKRTPPGMS